MSSRGKKAMHSKRKRGSSGSERQRDEPILRHNQHHAHSHMKGSSEVHTVRLGIFQKAT